MIQYHGMPLSSDSQKHEIGPEFLKGRHALVSFANPQSLPIVAESCLSFVLDNGAFTFWKGGKQPDWDDYYLWVREWERHPGYEWHIIPDIIDGTEDDNWRLMFEYGRKADYGVPVYHMHESMKHLERLVTNYPRIAIGSSGEWPNPGTKSWWKRMAEIMEVVCDDRGRPRCKLHGLRMLNPVIFSQIPLSSADSCNAAINSGSKKRFGPYMPPTAAMRAAVIADRLAAFNSPAVWAPKAADEIEYGFNL